MILAIFVVIALCVVPLHIWTGAIVGWLAGGVVGAIIGAILVAIFWEN